MGFYPFSPADPAYIISVPLFDKVDVKAGDKIFIIIKKNAGKKIGNIMYCDKKIDGYFISHGDLMKGNK